jgi:hypothetical protein
METDNIDPTTLQKGDVVHYYTGLTSKYIGTVKEDNLYKDGIEVVGDGWKQYVGKWFIFKVERDGKVIFSKDDSLSEDGSEELEGKSAGNQARMNSMK